MSAKPNLQEQYEEIDAALASTECEITAAELHGLTSAMVVCGFRQSPQEWLDMMAVHLDFKEDLSEEDVDLLFQLFGAAYDELTDKELSFNFQLVLPDDDYPLADRLQSLAEWCRGYAEGIGLSEVGEEVDADPESREFLRDIIAISQLDDDTSGGAEEENRFAELVEYIRVCCMSMYSNIGLKKLADDIHPPENETIH